MSEEFRGFTLSDRGYGKYKCSKCGLWFWSRVERGVCPDRPCSKYDFLYKEYKTVKKLELDEARKEFIDFFVSKGHGYMDPYPVLARWRNDLYLTIASIVVFQPMVTNGLIEPPHNPLVIVQPSIRLEDIDNVGFTFGRHLTSFEMGGHHAFNYKDKRVYWIKETVEYAIEFFTRRIGIPEDDIVLKESWWEGGGNAGPAFEVLVDGMELATLVFMKYRVVNGKYEPNPVLVVDTGYGIERIAWFTQKTPTAYHAIFKDLVKKYNNVFGVEELEHDVLRKIAYLLSDVDIQGVGDLEKKLSEHGLREYLEELVKSIRVYTVLDHVKTLLLMLSNGIVPSNSGEGYLARLVLRRLLRTMLNLGVEIHKLEDVLLQLIDMQIQYWKGRYVYDSFHKHRDYIVEVSSIETRKFIDNITRGISVVDRYIRKKKTSITVDDLIKLYDAHGIPPEIVAERARKYGIEVNVPPDFYARVASLHGSSGSLVKEKEYEVSSDVVAWASKLPGTKTLFHKSPYQKTAKATVVGVYDKYVVFDQTIFYPRAGGQDNDTGYIITGDTRYRVVNVYKIGDVIVHELDQKPRLNPGSEVVLSIDWTRRYRLMRHHTATHILLGVARKILGDHVWQAGVEKTVEKARLDITHYKPLTEEEIEAIEREANRIVDEHLNVEFHYLNKFDAEKKYGIKIYQGGAIYSPILRIVEIPGIDAEACFGTHVYNTAEVGGIKILRTEKIQDGVIRIEFTVATRLAEYLSDLLSKEKEALKLLGGSGDLVVTATRVKNRLEELEKLLSSYRKALRDLIIEKATKDSTDICGVNTIILETIIDDEQLYKSVVEEFSLKRRYLVVLLTDKYVELAVDPSIARDKSIDLRKAVKIMQNFVPEVKGGGKPDHVFIRVSRKKLKREQLMNVLREIICGKEK
ncbi:MAG: alanine--tRNA ligase [Thermoprotei archaeon]